MSLRFIHISDTHFHPDPQFIESGASFPSAKLLDALLSQLQKLPFTPAFVLHTGDVVVEATSDAYNAIHKALSTLPCPVYYTAGNLDNAQLMQQILLREQPIRKELFYDFEVDGVHVVCLDSNGCTNAEGQHLGKISDEQLEWLENICASSDDRLMVVALHHMPLAVDIRWLDENMRLVNGERLHEILLKARHRLRGVFHGHIHQPMEVVRDGILYCCTSSAPYQFEAHPTMQPYEIDSHALPSFTVVTVTHTRTITRRYLVQVT